MIRNNSASLMQRRPYKISVTVLRIFTLMILTFFAVSPVLGQMGSSVTYSDTWLDTSGVDNSRAYSETEVAHGAYLYRRATTQDNYNSYGHRYYVKATLTSPTRSTSATSSTSTSYASSTVSLALDVNIDGFIDPGTYTGRSDYFLSCPYINGGGFFAGGGGSSLITPGLSVTCYKQYDNDAFLDYYDIISDCHNKVSCIGPSDGKYALPGIGNTARQTVQAYWLSSDGGATRHCTGAWFPFNNIFRDCTSASCRDFPGR